MESKAETVQPESHIVVGAFLAAPRRVSDTPAIADLVRGGFGDERRDSRQSLSVNNPA